MWKWVMVWVEPNDSLRLQDEWEVASERARGGKTSRRRDTGLVLKVHVWVGSPGLRSWGQGRPPLNGAVNG